LLETIAAVFPDELRCAVGKIALTGAVEPEQPGRRYVSLGLDGGDAPKLQAEINDVRRQMNLPLGVDEEGQLSIPFYQTTNHAEATNIRDMLNEELDFSGTIVLGAAQVIIKRNRA
jgi:hypothetical protein